MKTASSEKESWFRIRRELSGPRQSMLTVISFLMPLALWCFFSYVPFIWHPDIKLEVGASGTTIYTAGDHIGRDYFPTVVEGVRDENAAVRLARNEKGTLPQSTRENKKILRQISDIAVANGVLREDQNADDAAIYEVWRDVATGELIFKRPALSPENMEIVRANWSILKTYSESYDSAHFPAERLYRLVPQGRRANPVYLPAPHEVLITGIADWTRVPSDGKPSMRERLLQSLKTVFGGFLLAALIAIPIGVLAGSYDFFGKLIEPFVDFFRYMPAPAFGTLLVAVLGAHQAPKLALVFIGTFPHLLLMLTKTTRLLDAALLEAAQTLGANRWQLLTRVVLPGIWPNVYNDLRIALGWAWTWLVIAELIGVKMGLTEVIDTQGDRRNFDRVFPVIILIGMIGFFTDQLLSILRGLLFSWTAGTEGKQGFIERRLRRLASWFGPALEAHR